MKFISDHNGTANKQEVIDHMASSAEVPTQFRTSRVTTLNLIDELDGDRIRVLKRDRKGQSDRLSINDKSRFDWIDQHLTEIAMAIEKMDEDKAEITLPLKKGGTVSVPSNMFELVTLCALAFHVSRDIKNKNDVQLLNDKILQLMINMGIKNIRQISKKFSEQLGSQ